MKTIFSFFKKLFKQESPKPANNASHQTYRPMTTFSRVHHYGCLNVVPDVHKLSGSRADPYYCCRHFDAIRRLGGWYSSGRVTPYEPSPADEYLYKW